MDYMDSMEFWMEFWAESLAGISIIIIVLTVIVHLCFAVAVFLDARKLPRKPIFVLPIVWSVATLLGGLFVAVAYWVIHHSRLNQSIDITLPDDSDDSHESNEHG